MTQALQERKTTLRDFLIKQKDQIAAALPKHLTADRMLRIVMTELRKTPKLGECNPVSLVGAVIQCSQLGLEPGGVLGHAYLIPFGNECQFIVGYRGMIDLARRSGQIVSVSAHEVYSNDKFEYCYGIDEKCIHQPAIGERGEFIGAYSVVKLKDGGHQFEFMSKHEIEKIRNKSKAKNNGPWVTNYEEMAKKTVIRRIFKYLPISIEIQKAVTLDESAERGEQNNKDIIEGELIQDSEILNSLSENEPQTKADKIAENL